MYKIDNEKILFSDNKLFAILPSVDFGSTCAIYKVRVGKVIYELKFFNWLQRVTLDGCKELQKLNIE